VIHAPERLPRGSAAWSPPIVKLDVPNLAEVVSYWLRQVVVTTRHQ
jgi:hypothetical protein